MSQAACPRTPRELLVVLQEFTAGQEMSAGLDVDPAECRADLVALAKSLPVLTAALAKTVVRYDRLDAGSPVAILVQDGHLTRVEADNLRKLGHQLQADLPATREKLEAGEVGVAQAKAIAALDKKLADSPSQIPPEARRELEAVLSNDAVAATTQDTALATTIAHYRIDPDTAEKQLRDQHDKRCLTLSKTMNGARHIDGLLGPAAAAIWEKHFDRMAAPASPDDTRTAAMRRADAVTDLIELHDRITTTPNHDADDTAADLPLQESCNSHLASDTDDGTETDTDTPADLRLHDSCNGHSGGKPYQRPSTWQTGEDPATGEPGKGFAWRKSSPANLMIIATHDLITGKPGAEPATLGDGTIIPAETARRYACEAALNRVLLADGDQPLQLGRTRRLFTPMQVKAMTVRDGTCRWKGCEVPAIRCSPHHWLPWSQGGTTDPINGVMLCPTHHRMCHEDQPHTELLAVRMRDLQCGDPPCEVSPIDTVRTRQESAQGSPDVAK